jgi:hypothetical protein
VPQGGNIGTDVWALAILGRGPLHWLKDISWGWTNPCQQPKPELLLHSLTLIWTWNSVGQAAICAKGIGHGGF